jgi:hypothetical protein
MNDVIVDNVYYSSPSGGGISDTVGYSTYNTFLSAWTIDATFIENNFNDRNELILQKWINSLHCPISIEYFEYKFTLFKKNNKYFDDIVKWTNQNQVFNNQSLLDVDLCGEKSQIIGELYEFVLYNTVNSINIYNSTKILNKTVYNYVVTTGDYITVANSKYMHILPQISNNNYNGRIYRFTRDFTNKLYNNIGIKGIYNGEKIYTNKGIEIVGDINFNNERELKFCYIWNIDNNEGNWILLNDYSKTTSPLDDWYSHNSVISNNIYYFKPSEINNNLIIIDDPNLVSIELPVLNISIGTTVKIIIKRTQPITLVSALNMKIYNYIYNRIKSDAGIFTDGKTDVVLAQKHMSELCFDGSNWYINY